MKSLLVGLGWIVRAIGVILAAPGIAVLVLSDHMIEGRSDFWK